MSPFPPPQPDNTGISERTYQVKAKTDVYQAWRGGKRSVMLQMPTGTGKSHVMASIIRDFDTARTNGREELKERVLLVAHRKEIIDQMARIVRGQGLLPSFIVSGGGREREYNPARRVQLASVDTLSDHTQNDWLDRLFPPRLILIDEAHHAAADTYRSLWDRFPEALFLGVSATPARLSGEPLTDLFDHLVTSESIPWFMGQRYLSEVNYWSRPLDADLKALPMVGGDYDTGRLDEVYGKNNQVLAGLFESYEKHAFGKQGIIYAINIDHGARIADKFISNGVKARFIHGATPQREREDVIMAFRAKTIEVIVNVNLFTEGFDAPDMDFVQLARPTKSLTLYLQMVGRALRTTDPPRTKLILDNAGLFHTLGDFRTEWPWPELFAGIPVLDQPVEEGEAVEQREPKGLPLIEKEEDLVEIKGPEVPVSFAESYLCLVLLDFLPFALALRVRTMQEEWTYEEVKVDRAFELLDDDYVAGRARYQHYRNLVEERHEVIGRINSATSVLNEAAIRKAITRKDIEDTILSHLRTDKAKDSFRSLTQAATDLNTILAYMTSGYATEMASILGSVYDEWDEMVGLRTSALEPADFEALKAQLRAIEEQITDIYEAVIEFKKVNVTTLNSDSPGAIETPTPARQVSAQPQTLPDVGQDQIGSYCRAFLSMDKEAFAQAIANRDIKGRGARFKALQDRLESQLNDKRPLDAYDSFFKLLRMAKEVGYKPTSLSAVDQNRLSQFERILHNRTQLISWILKREGPIRKRALEERIRYFLPYSSLTSTMIDSWLRQQPEFTVDGEGLARLAT